MSSTAARVAIVTGGSRGIGRQVVDRLAADGYAVVVNYASNDAEGKAAVAEVADKGGQAIAVRADVGDAQAVAALFDAAEQAFGGVDVVVNAAGIMNPPTPLAELDLDVLDRMLRVNVRGTFVVGPAGRPPAAPGWCPDHLLHLGHRTGPARLRRLRRLQGCRRGPDPHPRP